jgi:hypothetical protein
LSEWYFTQLLFELRLSEMLTYTLRAASGGRPILDIERRPKAILQRAVSIFFLLPRFASGAVKKES